MYKCRFKNIESSSTPGIFFSSLHYHSMFFHRKQALKTVFSISPGVLPDAAYPAVHQRFFLRHLLGEEEAFQEPGLRSGYK